ncbi:hypothetical protein CF319_g5087 [Tilletia indica]|nr:hypothetical protein CF319_g5087 [Tilletia indica]
MAERKKLFWDLPSRIKGSERRVALLDDEEDELDIDSDDVHLPILLSVLNNQYSDDMGKRKSAKKPNAGKKKLAPLQTNFNCLFCNGVAAILCKIDKNEGVGSLSCKLCGTKWSCPIQDLDEPIDIYSYWIDACDEVAAEQYPAIEASSSRSGRR